MKSACLYRLYLSEEKLSEHLYRVKPFTEFMNSINIFVYKCTLIKDRVLNENMHFK